MHSCLSMNLFATFAFLLPGHPTLSTTFDYLKQRKKTAEKIDTNAQWFHCSWSILLKRVNIRVRGFHLVFLLRFFIQYLFFLPCDIGGAKDPGMMYFPTKWGANEHQNPKNPRVVFWKIQLGILFGSCIPSADSVGLRVVWSLCWFPDRFGPATCVMAFYGFQPTYARSTPADQLLVASKDFWGQMLAPQKLQQCSSQSSWTHVSFARLEAIPWGPHIYIWFGSTPGPVIATTRIIIFFRIGNPNLNLHLWLASWVGGRPNI